MEGQEGTWTRQCPCPMARDIHALIRTWMNQGNQLIVNEKNNRFLNRCDEHVKKRILPVIWMQEAPYFAYAIVRKENLNKTGWPIHHARIRGGSIQNWVKPTVKVTTEYKGVYIEILEQGKNTCSKKLHCLDLGQKHLQLQLVCCTIYHRQLQINQIWSNQPNNK